MARQVGEHRAALVDAGIRIDLAEHGLVARLVEPLHECEFTAVDRLLGRNPGPAGDHVGEARDVGLGVTAADAERVQFEDLAGEILVQPLVAVDAVGRIGAHRLDVVQIEQHAGMALDRQQQIGKAAEHVGPDRFPLERAGHLHDLVRRDAEMVRPEPHQPLDEADIGTQRRVEARFGFVLKELLRQRRRRRLSRFRYWRWRLLVCGIVRKRRGAWLARRLAAIEEACGILGFSLFLHTKRELLLRRLLGAKVRDLTRRLAARRQVDGKKAGLRALQIRKQRAARVGGNRGDPITRRA